MMEQADDAKTCNFPGAAHGGGSRFSFARTHHLPVERLSAKQTFLYCDTMCVNNVFATPMVRPTGPLRYQMGARSGQRMTKTFF